MKASLRRPVLCGWPARQHPERCLAALFPPPLAGAAVPRVLSVLLESSTCCSAVALPRTGHSGAWPEIFSSLPFGFSFANANLYPFKLGALRLASQNTTYRPLICGLFQRSRDGLLTGSPLVSRLSHSPPGERPEKKDTGTRTRHCHSSCHLR